MVPLYLHLDLEKVAKSPLQDEESFFRNVAFSNDDLGQLKDHFEKRSKNFVHDMSKNSSLFDISYRCHILGESNPSPIPNFQISEFPCLKIKPFEI